MIHWPEIPALPVPGEPVVVRIPPATSRAAARSAARVALNQILREWTPSDAEPPLLRETPHGPVCDALLGGQSISASIAYAGSEPWIALLRGGIVGLDVAPVVPMPDLHDVAELYLGPAAVERLRRAPDQARTFALEWSRREATVKCFGQSLREWSANDEQLSADARVQSQCLDSLALTLVFDPTRPVRPDCAACRRAAESPSRRVAESPVH